MSEAGCRHEFLPGSRGGTGNQTHRERVTFEHKIAVRMVTRSAHFTVGTPFGVS